MKKTAKRDKKTEVKKEKIKKESKIKAAMKHKAGKKNSTGKKNISVKEKISSGYNYLITALALIMAVNTIIIGVISVQYRNAITNYGMTQGVIGQFGIEFNAMVKELHNIILEDQKYLMRESEQLIKEQGENMDVYLEQVSEMATTKEEEELISTLQKAMKDYNAIRKQIVILADQNKKDKAYALLIEDGTEPVNAVKESIDRLLEIKIEMCNKTKTRTLIFSFVLVDISILLGVSAFISGKKTAKKVVKSICDPLEEVKSAAEELSAGNLQVNVNYTAEDEIGVMAESFRNACSFLQAIIRDLSATLETLANGSFDVESKHRDAYKGDFSYLLQYIDKMKAQMNSALLNVRMATAQVTAGAGQLADNAQNLAEGATEQAGAVEELTATIENITAMVIESAEKAQNAYLKSASYADEAGKSSEAMNELSEAMVRISEVSRQIGNIIGEIEDIASQTNLLSLNASIEAARAGDAGRGFSVVASQIGKLATDSAQSAVNTKKLIENAIKEVEKGTQIAGRTSDALNSVVTGIHEMGLSMKATSESAREQADSMKQIEAGIEQIASVVQSNSAASEEASATSQELSAQAAALNEEVDKFRLLEA